MHKLYLCINHCLYESIFFVVESDVVSWIDVEVFYFMYQVCFLPGTLALGATKGLTKEKAMKDNLLTFEDLENLKLAEDLAKTCFEMYSVTSTGLAPEIAYFHTKVVSVYLFLESSIGWT